jgi:hypothetical protein
MRRPVLAVLAALLAPAAGLAADQGEVVWVDPSCNHFIAKVDDEFGTYNWRAGNAPRMGDRIEGDLTSVTEASAREVQNLTAGSMNTVYLLALGRKLHAMIHTAPVQCKERFRGSVR